MSILKRLGHKLVDNLLLKILALVLGLLIWIVVVSIDNPVRTQIFTSIPVNVENEEIMEKEKKAFEVAESSRTVSVSVRAERAVLDQLSRDNFIASIDLANYSDGRVPINVRATRYADRITSVTPRTPYAVVTVEDLGQRQFTIEPEVTGEVSEGYSIGDVVVANNLVRVSGPVSVVEIIDRAVARVSVQGITRDIRTESKIEFYDKNGNSVPTTDLELSRTDTNVTISIWNNKEVPVIYGYTGIPADGYAATGNVIATINNVMLKGPASALSGVDSVEIPAAAVDITGADNNVTAAVDIELYLPAGVDFANMDDNTISNVTVEIQALDMINVEVPVSNIIIDNVPEGMNAVIGGGTQQVVVSVRGLASTLSAVNPAMITGRIDLSGLAQSLGVAQLGAGVYDAEVAFTYPEGVYSGNTPVIVSVILSHHEVIGDSFIEMPQDTEEE